MSMIVKQLTLGLTRGGRLLGLRRRSVFIISISGIADALGDALLAQCAWRLGDACSRADTAGITLLQRLHSGEILNLCEHGKPALMLLPEKRVDCPLTFSGIQMHQF